MNDIVAVIHPEWGSGFPEFSLPPKKIHYLVFNMMGTLRGTELNVGNRFEQLRTERVDDGWDSLETLELPVVQTQFFPDHTKSILAKNDSPDLNFRYSINVYRGCEHGCAYCYARPTHEYLGFDPALDFETKIMVKENAPELLRQELSRKGWTPTVVMMSGNTDCYQPAERHYRLTRRVLEVFLEFRNPIGIITKNALVTRDIDLLSEMAKLDLVHVMHSITTLDRDLARKLEPRTSTPERRLASLAKMRAAGIPVGVMIGPVIPGLNDDEIPAILKASAEAGATMAGYNMIRLPYAVAPIFEEWLKINVPLEAEKVMKRIGMVRSGKKNDPEFGSRMRGEGAYADYIKQTFKIHAKKYGMNQGAHKLSTEHFRRSGELSLFD